MNKDKRALRAKAHHLNPVVSIGNKGLTKAVQLEIDQALNAHELIKIKMSIPKQDYPDTIKTIMAEQQADWIQTIGRIIVIYRHNSDKD